MYLSKCDSCKHTDRMTDSYNIRTHNELPNRSSGHNRKLLTFCVSHNVMSNPAPPAARPMETRVIALASSGNSLIFVLEWKRGYFLLLLQQLFSKVVVLIIFFCESHKLKIFRKERNFKMCIGHWMASHRILGSNSTWVPASVAVTLTRVSTYVKFT